ncbi:hypothetical protein D9758_003777 [Tetrapyrgos nigripes]|uniref:Angiogenic factor with G patch and FHA domains 1 n=1 Tax=Tetrapyrgos nigripes TaxID=182062 RepID=A0A8H5LRJ5_9AGAR|nr:hypothetical protein D9758_003777 [Tetrapyrgos nigripes]
MDDTSTLHSSSTHNTGTHDSAEYTYDISYEWPWDPVDPHSDVPLRVSQHQKPDSSTHHANGAEGCLRLLVSASQALPPSHRIALLDGFTEIQFGRDATDSGVPKVRLKEMEVSKLHATVYWDESWNGWGLVDMGSKHGTFLRSAAEVSAKVLDTRGIRLSSPKSASIPRRLYHFDEITLGGTTFVVHIHDDGLPCQECSPIGGDEIPLFPTAKKNFVPSRKASALEATHSAQRVSHDPRGKLVQLKRSLLAKHNNDSSPHVPEHRYIDRSAVRRALNPSSLSLEAPGVAHHQVSLIAPSEPKSHPEVPIPPSSVGHRLLMKQGWRPGQSLGLHGEGRVEPVDTRASSSYERAGLGLKLKSSQSEDGYGSNKYSRWDR